MTTGIQIQSGKQAQLAAEVARLQNLFRDSLSRRFADIDQAWSDIQQQMRACAVDEDSLKTLHRLVHTLTGSAGTFAMPKLSYSARKLEVQIKLLILGQVKQLDRLIIQQIDDLILLLKQSAKQSDKPNDSVALTETQVKETVANPRQQAVEDTGHLQKSESVEIDVLNNQVLLIEKEGISTQRLVQQLFNAGYQVIRVPSMAEARNRIQYQRPRLMICDLTLCAEPLSPVTFLRNLQQEPDDVLNSFPIIFISDETDIQVRLEVARVVHKTYGRTNYFNKPLNFTALMSKVSELTYSDERTPYKVLVVDEDPNLCAWITAVLNEVDVASQSITSPLRLLEAIAANKPDLIVLEDQFEVCSGIELAEVIRQDASFRRIPVMFLSSEIDASARHNAAHWFGDDVLAKPLDKMVLQETVLAKARRARALNKHVMRDCLTGLYNRPYIQDLLERTVELIYRNPKGHSLSLVMINIDYVGQINEAYGYVSGDAAIRSLANLLISDLRKTDIVGRFSDERFAVIMPDTTKEEALRVINNLRLAFATTAHPVKEDVFQSTFSAGIASTEDFIEAVLLIQKAEQAESLAKISGRNLVCVAKRETLKHV